MKRAIVGLMVILIGVSMVWVNGKNVKHPANEPYTPTQMEWFLWRNVKFLCCRDLSTSCVGTAIECSSSQTMLCRPSFMVHARVHFPFALNHSSTRRCSCPGVVGLDHVLPSLK